MTRLADVAVYWNGTAVNQTVGNVTRALQGYLVANATALTPTEEVMFESVSLETGAPIVGEATGHFTVRGTTSTTSSLVAIEREMLDDWSLMGLRYNPFDGLVELRVDRKDATNTTVSRALMVRAVEVGTVSAHRGGMEPGLRLSDTYSSSTAVSKPHYYYLVNWRAPYGLWRDRTATTATATATTSGVTLAATNSGIRDVPCRVTIGATTGSPTTVRLILSSTAHLIAANPTTGQYYDFAYTTAGEHDGNLTIDQSIGDLRIPAGTTNYTAQVTGGTGTVEMTLTYKAEYGSW